jgi:Peptidase S46
VWCLFAKRDGAVVWPVASGTESAFAPGAHPVNKNLQKLTLAYVFTTTRHDLGEGDPFVRRMLGDETPAQLADRLISGTHLDDPKVREALYDGGQAAIAASSDPLICFAVSIDPDLRAVRKEYEDQVVAPTRSNAERIANGRFEVYGTSVDPDATFTLRLSYGTVKGFEDAQGHFVEPYTTIGGVFHHATGAPPFALPKSWQEAKSSLNMETPMNLSTTNDIIGGNSGSPLINSKAEIVGLIFDGNIFSLAAISATMRPETEQWPSIAVLCWRACKRSIISTALWRRLTRLADPASRRINRRAHKEQVYRRNNLSKNTPAATTTIKGP